MAERVAPRVEELLAVPWDRSSRARVRDPELGRHPHEVGERLGLHLLHEVIVETRGSGRRASALLEQATSMPAGRRPEPAAAGASEVGGILVTERVGHLGDVQPPVAEQRLGVALLTGVAEAAVAGALVS
jgi:hypothetical protein